MVKKAKKILTSFSTSMNIMKIIPTNIQNRFFMGKKINRLVKPFKLERIKNKPFLPDLAPANPSLPVKPKIACLKNEKAKKEFYSYMDYPYLLPGEIWSDKKIMDTVKLLGKDLDGLEKSDNLNKKAIQGTIDKMIPEQLKGKVIIKDFADLEEDMRDLGYSENAIKLNLKSQALTINYKQNSSLYINFEKANMDKNKSIDIKNSIEHEMTHVFSHKFQNIKITDLYKNECGICFGQAKIYNEIFSLFENHYDLVISFEPTELTQENMLNWLGYDSIEDLHKSFESAMEVFTKNARQSGGLSIDDRPSQKQFFVYLKHRAKEEKNAYHSNIRYREISKDLDTPTDAEFVPMLYAEMEKFFAQKEQMVTPKN